MSRLIARAARASPLCPARCWVGGPAVAVLTAIVWDQWVLQVGFIWFLIVVSSVLPREVARTLWRGVA